MDIKKIQDLAGVKPMKEEADYIEELPKSFRVLEDVDAFDPSEIYVDARNNICLTYHSEYTGMSRESVWEKGEIVKADLARYYEAGKDRHTYLEFNVDAINWLVAKDYIQVLQ